MAADLGRDVLTLDARPVPRPQPLHEGPGLVGVEVPHELTVSGITLDSRAVRPGDLYAALPGATTHGAHFAMQAVRSGAVAILTDAQGAQIYRAADADADADAGSGDTGGGAGAAVPVVVVPDPRPLLGALSSWVYGHPAQEMLLIGVTGTNGKTTVTYLLEAALRAVGHTPGTIGTIGVRVDEQSLPSARTTPEAPDVHALLAVMREQGVTAVAMEVSSHALVLGRVDGLMFDVAVFTNLSQDHLDFHETMDAYFAAKASLFTAQRSRRSVICVDDAAGRQLAAQSLIPQTTYAVTTPADWTLTHGRWHQNGSWSATAVGPEEISVAVSSQLPGEFNQANVLGALATVVVAGGQVQAAATGLARCPGVPGRLEPIPGRGVQGFVDYAHTPDAVARAIDAVARSTTGRVLVALGCGGDRDAGKRPAMGRVAARAADLVVVTDDNPRSEDPAMIRQAVLSGARQVDHAELHEIPDRRTAIRWLAHQAAPGDCVVVLGKGHEQGQEAAGVVTPFDDRVELRDALAVVRS